jgi:hypothetical protein
MLYWEFGEAGRLPHSGIKYMVSECWVFDWNLHTFGQDKGHFK